MKSLKIWAGISAFCGWALIQISILMDSEPHRLARLGFGFIVLAIILGMVYAFNATEYNDS